MQQNWENTFESGNCLWLCTWTRVLQSDQQDWILEERVWENSGMHWNNPLKGRMRETAHLPTAPAAALTNSVSPVFTCAMLQPLIFCQFELGCLMKTPPIHPQVPHIFKQSQQHKTKRCVTPHKKCCANNCKRLTKLHQSFPLPQHPTIFRT